VCLNPTLPHLCRTCAGLADTIREENLSLDTVRLCRESGAVMKQFSFSECSGGKPELIGVRRDQLQSLLLDAAGPDRVIMDAAVSIVDREPDAQGRVVVTLKNGQTVAARLVVGADGVRSVVARGLGISEPTFVGQAGYRGIAQFKGEPPVQPRTVCQACFATNPGGYAAFDLARQLVLLHCTTEFYLRVECPVAVSTPLSLQTPLLCSQFRKSTCIDVCC
jgi:2-polyprenyl-6-methoxyphenol hydroxylase-like FAD-dependent oxidoreductase